MITIEAHKKKIHIPDRWDELNKQQYLAVVLIIEDIIAGNLSFFDAKLKLLELLSGYKRSNKRFSEEQSETINNNLVILSEMIRFVFRPDYPDKEILEVLSPELQEALKHKFPFEIFSPEMTAQIQMLGDRLKYRISLNLDMRCNPIPLIRSGYRNYKGPLFKLDENLLLQTDMMAEEYIDALAYYRLYHQTKNESYLNGMIACLYRPNRAEYSTVQQNKLQSVFHNKAILLKKGVFYFFQSIQEYLMERSPYQLLYGTEKSTEEKISLGMIDSLYSLSKEGYGSKEELSRLNLVDFLNLRLKQIIDAVQSLRAQKKKVHEIAEIMKMPIETIQSI